MTMFQTNPNLIASHVKKIKKTLQNQISCKKKKSTTNNIQYQAYFIVERKRNKSLHIWICLKHIHPHASIINET
jgi:hypothetical protein